MENSFLLIKSILSGLKFILSRGSIRWIRETKAEEGFTWLETIGVVFMQDYRQEKHWQRLDREDW